MKVKTGPDKDFKGYVITGDDYFCKIVDEREDNVFECQAFEKNTCKYICYILFCILTVGFLALVTYWKAEWKLYLTHSRCKLSQAETVYLLDQYGTVFVEKVYKSDHQVLEMQPVTFKKTSYKFFYHMKYKYYFNETLNAYNEIETFDDRVSLYALHQSSISPHFPRRYEALDWFGQNIIDVQVNSYLKLFLQESADPFYIFQLFSCILWFSDDYYYYAAAIVFISVTSIIISIYQTRKHLITLRNMISHSVTVTILNSVGQEIDISSRDLLPGDVLVIPKDGCTLLCDAALISGTAIVNESMLTGESVPVTKTPLPRPSDEQDANNELYNTISHKRHTLFCGTQVLQTRYFGNERVLAVVVKTGFTTMKGGLIRSILYPKAVDFKFFKDALKFVGVLAIFAVIGLVYSIYIFYTHGSTTGEMIKKALDVITIAVPPALPAAMSVGTVYALQRLKKKNIFCISPSRVNISGSLNMFCFDKTGTLTEDGLDFCGIIPLYSEGFDEFQQSVSLRDTDHFTIGMASCHSLTIIDGNITGDPLDLKMFQATKWEIEEIGSMETERYGMVVPTVVRPRRSASDSSHIEYSEKMSLPLEIAVLKQFTFSSDLQRMSVIVRRLGARNMDVYVKGSPEMIASLCKKDTIPHSFDECLQSYTKQGYRVLALSYKSLPPTVQWHKIQQYTREQAESDLTFLGFIVMKNLLKPITPTVIRRLNNAKIRTVMVTGDNMLTAISVARECGMVKESEKIVSISQNEPGGKLHFVVQGGLEHSMERITYDNFEGNFARKFHYAVTGKVFAHIFKEEWGLFEQLLAHGTIFARMLPDQKTQLVEGLQSLGYSVGMCGDGANDCGALKRADAGISLSEAEASVASPFTSKDPNISCVVEVVKEGRCALVTSFNIFKYMALYSMIQYSSVLMLYYTNSNLGDLQYLYIDLFIIMPIAVTMSRTGPSEGLVAQRPLGRLVHPFVLFSMILQVLTHTTFQILLFFYVRNWLPGYKDVNYFAKKFNIGPDDTPIVCYETTALFTFTTYQYILIALVFSVGRPFRKPFYTNYLLVLSAVIFLALDTLLAVKPFSFLQDNFKILSLDNRNYYFVFYGMLLCNLMCSILIDYGILKWSCMKNLLLKLQPVEKNRYEELLESANVLESVQILKQGK